MIEKYINEIVSWDNFELQFRGDGRGDFEKLESTTTESCLKRYKMHCKDQIRLANLALKKLKELK